MPRSGLRRSCVRLSADLLLRCPMPKPLPEADFRARRVVLTRQDFAFAPKPAPRPSDMIDKATWDSIVVLPDDVAVRTSNYHGTALMQLHDLWGAWIESVGDVQDRMFPAMLDAGDDFQAATYTALTGFYRLSIAALRSALELTTISAWAQVCMKHQEFRRWRTGKSPVSFGQACDGLCGETVALRTHLRATVDDNLSTRRRRATKAAFAGEYTVACQTSLMRVPDTPMEMCVRAMARSTCARLSITWRGCNLKLSVCASCCFCSPVPSNGSTH